MKSLVATAAAAATGAGWGSRRCLGVESGWVACLDQRGDQCRMIGVALDASPASTEVDRDIGDARDRGQRLNDMTNTGAARHALYLKIDSAHENLRSGWSVQPGSMFNLAHVGRSSGCHGAFSLPLTLAALGFHEPERKITFL